MTPDLPFLAEGDNLPVDLQGNDLEGSPLDVDQILANHARTLVYFYPFDNREEPPAAWKLLEEHASELEEKNIGIVGVRGPGEATRKAHMQGTPFPVIEDHNYRLGQAVGVLGGERGDDIEVPEVPRALVALDAEGHVMAAERGDDPETLRRLLGGAL